MQETRSFVVGDIQGCHRGLLDLLDTVNFNADVDTLYAVGDLVARGDDSLSTLRYLKSLGSSFYTVLGNHDLHLLAVASGIREAKKSDNLQPLIDAPDFNDLIDWLRTFPLALRINKHNLLVHAGLFPEWSFKDVIAASDSVSSRLRSDDYVSFLKTMYGNMPTHFNDASTDEEKTRFTVNACTRMRYLHPDNRLEFSNKSHPANAATPSELVPWFNVPNSKLKKKQKVIFGHWAALNGDTEHSQFIGLDTGYVWGQTMSLLHIESGTITQVNAKK
ncbi:symmetrical bis(5'-nucleosyl)-tetraphosphatase [Alteromonas sp. A079]|uniref:symmetrical bis(5'-nucleosyl)-tetraphosphatase n=1 Tax=Alteromonas sp. A079 TaxID=3410268 RepID=UPI003BA2D5E3